MINQQQQPAASELCETCPLFKAHFANLVHAEMVAEERLREALDGLTLPNGSRLAQYHLHRSRKDREVWVLEVHEVRFEGKVIGRSMSTNDMIDGALKWSQIITGKKHAARNRGYMTQHCIEFDMFGKSIEIDGQKILVFVEHIDLEWIAVERDQ